MQSTEQFLTKNFVLRRGVVLLFHVVGVFVCYLAAHLIRFDFYVPEEHWESLWKTLPWVMVSYLGCVFAFGLYRGLWRFFTLQDCLVTTLAFGTGTILSGALIFLFNGFSFEGVPRSVLIIVFMLLLLWEIGGRGLVRLARESRQRQRIKARSEATEKRLLLVGDADEADALLRGLQKYESELGQVVGLISEGNTHDGSRLRGVRIYSGLDRVADLVGKLDVSTLLFLPPFTGPSKIRSVIDELGERQLTCDYRVIPSMDEIASGKIDVSGIRKVAISDLLYRVPYESGYEGLIEKVEGRKILVSGAGGSIGSEICRQLIKFKPSALVLYEISEFLLFLIEREIAPIAKEAGVELVGCTGDVRREDQLRSAIRGVGGVDLFYHAAAYKHVDLMERNPAACFQNNVVGSNVAATVAEEEGVKHFVLISTDKAVRPTSLMGASKRLAERLIIERPECGTSFKAVRFGNVLGSNGSVIPIFQEQIAKGGPVTVTSKSVTRFFMTIPEAVELVLAAGAGDEDRRVFVLEMGEPVKIDSLARRMIKLSGFIPDQDIKVVYTGLKSGEKEYEELLTDDEDVVRTDMDRIWVVKGNEDSRGEPVNLSKLKELIDANDGEAIRQFAHECIPGSRLMD